jgi:hypothetical protein
VHVYSLVNRDCEGRSGHGRSGGLVAAAGAARGKGEERNGRINKWFYTWAATVTLFVFDFVLVFVVVVTIAFACGT